MRDDEALVTIAIFDTVWEASVARGALEAAGIRALVPEEKPFGGSRDGIFTPTGRLQVLKSDRKRSLEELHRRQIRLVQPPSGQTPTR